MLKLQLEQLETLRRNIKYYIDETDIHILTKDGSRVPSQLFIDDLINHLIDYQVEL